jgi:hypothetical protein
MKLALAGVLALLLLDWRYGKQLAEQAGSHQADLTAICNAAAAQVRADQDKRLALEQRLSASDQTHHEALTNAQKDQARLRDRLATSDLRLSVLLGAADSASGCAVPGRYRHRRRGSSARAFSSAGGVAG